MTGGYVCISSSVTFTMWCGSSFPIPTTPVTIMITHQAKMLLVHILTEITLYFQYQLTILSRVSSFRFQSDSLSRFGEPVHAHFYFANFRLPPPLPWCAQVQQERLSVPLQAPQDQQGSRQRPRAEAVVLFQSSGRSTIKASRIVQLEQK